MIKITLLTESFEKNFADEYAGQSKKIEIKIYIFRSLIIEIFKGIQFPSISGAKECAIEYFLHPRIEQFLEKNNLLAYLNAFIEQNISMKYLIECPESLLSQVGIKLNIGMGDFQLFKAALNKLKKKIAILQI